MKLKSTYDKAAEQVKTTTAKAVSEIKNVVDNVADITSSVVGSVVGEVKQDVSKTAKQTAGIAVNLFGKTANITSGLINKAKTYSKEYLKKEEPPVIDTVLESKKDSVNDTDINNQ